MMKSKVILPVCLAILALSACGEMYAEPGVSTRRLQVREEKLTEQVATAELNDDMIAGLVQDYTKSGSGPIDVTITYDPQSRTNTAMRAGDEAVRISRAMRKEGAREVVTGVLPVREQGSESVTIVSYSAYQAFAPANCGQLPGVENPALDHDPNYKLGCSVETVFARQIADPSDLLGDARPSASSDGRMGSNVVDTYRFGAPNEPLKGKQASD